MGNNRILDINKEPEKYYEKVSCRGKENKILDENIDKIFGEKEKFFNNISNIKGKELREEKKYLLDRPLELSYAQEEDIKKENPRETTIQRNFYIKFNKQADLTIGKIPSYEIPLFERKGKGRSSCIDLIGIKNEVLYLLELKNKKSNETLLRCILEIFT